MWHIERSVLHKPEIGVARRDVSIGIGIAHNSVMKDRALTDLLLLKEQILMSTSPVFAGSPFAVANPASPEIDKAPPSSRGGASSHTMPL